MNLDKSTDNKKLVAEFDLIADEYYHQHRTNIAISGEKPEYFAEYKIADLAHYVNKNNLPSNSIIDFGSGIGNSVPFFRKYFPQSKLNNCDVSSRSLEISKTRFPGYGDYYIINDQIPFPNQSQDIVFSACVFHHIPEAQHEYWLKELKRVTKPNGIIAIFEHNPFNPLTVKAVNTCPFDVNAQRINAKKMAFRVKECGWVDPEISYKLFFPARLSKLRSIEDQLQWLPLGAQYRMLAKN